VARTLIVGDIHGCTEEFDELLLALAYQPGRDRLVLVGDLVARGPDSRGVIDRAMEYHAESVRGNHDERVLQWWRAQRRHGRKEADRTVKLGEQHRQVVEALDRTHFDWLEACPLVLSLPEHGAVVVHAGVDPALGPYESPPKTLLTVRSIDASGHVTHKLQGVPWASRWRGPEHLVFGHDARRGLQLAPKATGIDTGCVYGRDLSALVLEAGQRIPDDPRHRHLLITRVPAHTTYCQPNAGESTE
jgi:hypothetical protein